MFDRCNTEEDFAAEYKLFRAIEDWCLDNFDRTKWRFDYSSTVRVCGIDIPARIVFCRGLDITSFRSRFNC